MSSCTSHDQGRLRCTCAGSIPCYVLYHFGKRHVLRPGRDRELILLSIRAWYKLKKREQDEQRLVMIPLFIALLLIFILTGLIQRTVPRIWAESPHAPHPPVIQAPYFITGPPVGG